MSNNTLKHLFAVFLPLIVGQLLVSCKQGNPEVSASLDRIEQVVQQRPDSALIELVSLDSLLDAGAVSIEGERISAEQEDREKKHLEQVRQLYAKRFIELNDLCESFYRVQGKIDEQKQIYKKVRMLIDGFVEPSQQKKLDSIIDANFNDAMKKVKSSAIGLNEMELQLYRLKVSGFSTVAICLIMHYDNPPAIKKRLQRIRKTILQSESPYKEEIASLM